jgi:restriction system protein
MAIPTYDRLLRPILALAELKPITRVAATEEMCRQFALTPADAEQRIPSGQSTYIGNRTGWAMTFLTKAGLIAKIQPKTYRATPRGIDFLRAHPDHIKVSDLRALPGWEDAWEAGRERRRAKAGDGADSIENSTDETSTPLEVIGRQVEALRDALRSRLLNAILAQTPEFFEQLVLDVLIAMGYGGSKEDAAERLGRSGDEGIDGRINQDALGLDQIMVQAKRYKPDNVIDRKTIQAFIGSLAGQGVTKGIFITTSSYAESAREFVLRGSTTKVVLVDGAMLIDLMIKHRIGARVSHTYDLYELDQNYFDVDE